MNRVFSAAPLAFTLVVGSCTSDGAQTASSSTGKGASKPGSAGADDSLPDASRELFNGIDFTNWDRYFGKPSATEPPLGLENDPRDAYSVVARDGEPALRISGEVWGSLISKEDEFCNFDLHAEYEWGSAVWPPLNAVDSGIMFL